MYIYNHTYIYIYTYIHLILPIFPAWGREHQACVFTVAHSVLYSRNNECNYDDKLTLV